MGELFSIMVSGSMICLGRVKLFVYFVNDVFLFSILSFKCQCWCMNKRLLNLCTVLLAFISMNLKTEAQANINGPLKIQLEGVYMQWRTAMIKKNYNLWAQYTAKHRQQHIKNRIVSEQKAFPAWVFQVPVAPPAIIGLKPLSVSSAGATATAVYFGKVDFGVGGNPTENILLLNFINEQGRWKYDKAEFIRLNELADVRKKLKGGDLTYIRQKDFQPTGMVPKMPIAVRPAKYIAKVYAFCPGREVKMKVNKVSDHRFQNTKVSEVVLGGGLDGLNEVQFATKSLEGSTGKEALCIRVYLMSTVKGVNPIKVYEYLVKEGGAVKQFGGANFTINQAEINKLKGQ